MEKFHEKLKKLRKEKGLTQQEVADFFGINQPVYQKWESGNRKPTYENLSMLACIFDVSIDFLLSEYSEISKERYLKFKRENMSIFPQRLKELRKEKGYTQQQIADEIGVNRGSYSNWEKGKREPNFETLLKLASILNTTTSYLLGESDICYEYGSDVR